MISRKYCVIFLILLISISFSNCGKKTGESASKTIEETRDSLVIVTIGVDSLSALDVLKQEHEPITVSSAMGTFIRGIDGIENNTKTFWLFSINGEMADKAADKIMTNDGDSIIWYFRQFGAEPDSSK